MTFIVLLVLVFIGVGVIWYFTTIYNGLVALKNDIEKSWSNIDVLLKQRHDELGKLLDVCKGYMQFEKTTFENIAKARSMYTAANTVDQKAQADQAVTSAVRGLF